MPEDTVDQVSWNMSQSLIIQISNNLSTANRAYLDGLLEKSFFALKAAKLRVSHHFNETEAKEFIDVEVDFNKASKKKDKDLMAQEFEKYNNLIMTKLNKYGYLIGKKEDKTKLVA